MHYLLAHINCFLYFYSMNQAVNIPNLSPEVAVLLQQKSSFDHAILEINSLVLSKNDLLCQKKNIIAEKQNIIVEKEAEI